MKKVIVSMIILMIVFMTLSVASAQTPLLASSKPATVAVGGSNDDSGWVTVKPTVSLGFQWYFNTEYTFDAHAAGMGGVTKRKYAYNGSPSIYLTGRVPVTFGKRLEVALAGTWAPTPGASEVNESDYDARGALPLLGGRDWHAYTNGVTADLQVSYALIKDFYFLKALAPAVGLRYDYWRTTYRDPYNVSPGFPVAAPTDMSDFYSSTLFPYYGLTATIGGLKTGWFGGDLKLSALNGWSVWGRARHKEDRNATGPKIDTFLGNLDSGGYFLDICGEYTMVSFAKGKGSVSLFVKYSLFNASGELNGTRYTSGESDTFDFEMDRSSIAGGISATITF